MLGNHFAADRRYDFAELLRLPLMEACIFVRLLNKDAPGERQKHLERAVWYAGRLERPPAPYECLFVETASAKQLNEVIQVFGLNSLETAVVAELLTPGEPDAEHRKQRACKIVDGLKAIIEVERR